jgi:hypothetical protein
VNIDWVIPCRYVEVHDNLGTIVGAGIDTYWLPSFPAQIVVLLAIRLLAMADELDPDQRHTATNRVRDPGGTVVSEMSGEFSVSAESARADWLAGLIVGTAVQLEVAEEGTYTIEHEVDGTTASLPIHIVQGTPPGAEPPAN